MQSLQPIFISLIFALLMYLIFSKKITEHVANFISSIIPNKQNPSDIEVSLGLAVGCDKQGFDHLKTLYETTLVIGFINSMDINVFIYYGVPINRELEKILGESFPFKKKVTSDNLHDAILNLIKPNGTFGGFSENYKKRVFSFHNWK